MDRNGDMVLSKEEFTSGLKLLNLEFKPHDLEALCNSVDLNGDGRISFPELRRLLNKSSTRKIHIAKREEARTDKDLLAAMRALRVEGVEEERWVTYPIKREKDVRLTTHSPPTNRLAEAVRRRSQGNTAAMAAAQRAREEVAEKAAWAKGEVRAKIIFELVKDSLREEGQEEALREMESLGTELPGWTRL